MKLQLKKLNLIYSSGKRRDQQIVRTQHGTVPNLLEEQDRNRAYCLQKISKSDYDNYLCTLLLPEEARRGSVAVRAFNIEVAQIRDQVTDRTIGEMRMQFWRDTIESIYDPEKLPPRGNPVISELQHAVEQHGLSKSHLLTAINARQKHLAEKPFDSVAALEEYAESTVSSINYLILQAVGIQEDHADQAASYLGKAQGIVTALRATPYYASRRRVLLPVELMKKHGASSKDFVKGKSSEAVQRVVKDLSDQAQTHLDAGRNLTKSVPRPGRAALLPAVATEEFLSRLEKAGHDPFHATLAARNQFLPMRLWWKQLRKAY